MTSNLAVESTLHMSSNKQKMNENPMQLGKSNQLNIYIVSTTYRYSFCKQMIIDKCIHPFSTFDQKSFYRSWEMIKRIESLYWMKISASKYIVVPWCGMLRSYRWGAKDPIAPLYLGKRPKLHPWILWISFKMQTDFARLEDLDQLILIYNVGPTAILNKFKINHWRNHFVI